MAHVRQQLRNYATQTLTDAKLKLGRERVNVYESRVYQLDSRQLPAIAVYSGDTNIDSDSNQCAPNLQKRIIQTRTVLAVTADKLVENDLDDLGILVENLLTADPSWGGVAVWTKLVLCQSAYTDETDRPFGLLDLLWESLVITLEGNAEAAIQQ